MEAEEAGAEAARLRRRRGAEAEEAGACGGGGGRCVHAERMEERRRREDQQRASPEMRSRVAGDEEQGRRKSPERGAGSPDRGVLVTFGDVLRRAPMVNC